MPPTPKEQPPADPAAEIAALKEAVELRTEMHDETRAEAARLRDQVKTLQADAEKRDADDGALPTYKHEAAATGHLEDRLARVTAHVSRIPKRGFNAEQKYPFVAHADVLDSIRPALAAEGVQFRSAITRTEAEPEYRPDGQVRATGGGMIWRMWRIEVSFTLACWNGDKRCEQTTEGWPGYAQDYSDKGASKALTSAIKTFLIQQFLVSTGDDPDESNIGAHAQQEGGQQDTRARSASGGGGRSATGSSDVRAARMAALDWNKELPTGVVGKIAKKLCGNGVIIKIEDVAVLAKVAKIAAAYKANPEAGEAWLAGDSQALSGEPDPADGERQEAATAPDVPADPADGSGADALPHEPVTPVEVPFGIPVESYDPALTNDELRQHALGINPRLVPDGDDTPF